MNKLSYVSLNDLMGIYPDAISADKQSDRFSISFHLEAMSDLVSGKCSAVFAPYRATYTTDVERSRTFNIGYFPYRRYQEQESNSAEMKRVYIDPFQSLEAVTMEGVDIFSAVTPHYEDTEIIALDMPSNLSGRLSVSGIMGVQGSKIDYPSQTIKTTGNTIKFGTSGDVLKDGVIVTIDGDGYYITNPVLDSGGVDTGDREFVPLGDAPLTVDTTAVVTRQIPVGLIRYFVIENAVAKYNAIKAGRNHEVPKTAYRAILKYNYSRAG